jgi:hypothetical protein
VDHVLRVCWSAPNGASSCYRNYGGEWQAEFAYVIQTGCRPSTSIAARSTSPYLLEYDVRTANVFALLQRCYARR